MKILAALSRFPWPIEKGDKLRAYYQLKGLAEKHEVHLVTLNEAEISAEDRKRLSFCASITVIPHSRLRVAANLSTALLSPLPFQVNYFRSPAMKRSIKSLIREKEIDVVFVQLIRLGMNLPFSEPVGWFLDYMDAFSIGMEKRIDQSGFFSRMLVKSEARRLKRYEAKIAASFDEIGIISDRDAEALPRAVATLTHIIPNGVGEQFFEDLPLPEHKDFDLIFFGNMGYHPNVQSARFLLDEVLPALEKEGLDLKLCIAGARPAPLIRAAASPKVEVTGFVDDIRTWILRSHLCIAPLVSGQGLQNKLLESMAMGMPTLTTPLANSALHAENGKEIIVCTTAAEFAVEIKKLLNDPERAALIGKAGKAFVEKHFRWTAMNQKLEHALEASIQK